MRARWTPEQRRGHVPQAVARYDACCNSKEARREGARRKRGFRLVRLVNITDLPDLNDVQDAVTCHVAAQQALAALTHPRDRRALNIIYQREIEGKTYREIGKDDGTDGSNVRRIAVNFPLKAYEKLWKKGLI